MSDTDEDEVAIASAIFVIMSANSKRITKKKGKPRRWWCTTVYKNRNSYGSLQLVNDLMVELAAGKYENFCRMSVVDLEILFNLIGPTIAKQDTHLRKAVTAKERLLVTLRFIATGDSYMSLSYTFRISPQLISRIVPEVCAAINIALRDRVQAPKTPHEWKKLADWYERRWNFPNCIGSIDGKHVVIQCPMHSGSEYFNYKSTFSIVLMVMCDGDYCITQANIGAQGRISDGGVFRNTELFRKLEKKELNLPNPKPLRDGGPHIPYVIVGDNAFPLTDFLMVPFRGEHDAGSIKRIFNYRLSRARRTVENVFGIMAAVFRILRKPILLEPNKARIVVQTCVVLHNFLRRSENSRNSYSPPGMFDSQEHGKVIPGLWRRDNDSISSLLPFPSVGRRTAQNPEGIRKEFAEYFMTVGRVEWQDTKA